MFRPANIQLRMDLWNERSSEWIVGNPYLVNGITSELTVIHPRSKQRSPLLSNASIWALIRERAVSGVAGCGDS